ncbi:aKG-HExxH-type peptide beta-hydroxylase [Actinomadura xylanilytica]|uniref:aKG-HExxH-type peptide beta-hydroxylase n=1 Tax=Actinomadura xylanilytica TaxID=887459 RepID=UPI00255AB26A|nr:HEXXH motif-containing putative peptide modification protein [Actinomadura xylanilytica]MDL4770778.1 HEXXH motif-containing putative peptide modification protein [Actinomadura xylanilytica]
MSAEIADGGTSGPTDKLDALLAQHPFGNADYITRQLHICYMRRLGKISPRLPSAGTLLDALNRAGPAQRHRVIGDTVVRCAVNHALRQVEAGTPYGMPLQQCGELFEEAADHLADGKPVLLRSAPASRLSPDLEQTFVWSDLRGDDRFSRAFRDLVDDNYGERPCTLEEDEQAVLAQAVRILQDTVPMVSRSTLRHTHLVAIFPEDGPFARVNSSSEFKLSGTVFLNRKLLSNPWRVAEHLLHETLHQQMYDFRHGHTLLVEDVHREDAPTFCSLWNLPDKNNWNIYRGLAAFHVYVHLGLFFTLAEERSAHLQKIHGPPAGITGRRKATTRAHYLAEQIRAVCWDEMGEAGKEYVEWFDSVLTVFDPAPPPSDSYVHLLLDRYEREARSVERLSACGPDLSDHLSELARMEIAGARSALAAIEAGEALQRLDDATAELFDAEGRLPISESRTRFTGIRSVVAGAILQASHDGYTLSESRVPDAIVRQMVETSSQRLKPLLDA